MKEIKRLCTCSVFHTFDVRVMRETRNNKPNTKEKRKREREQKRQRLSACV